MHTYILTQANKEATSALQYAFRREEEKEEALEELRVAEVLGGLNSCIRVCVCVCMCV